MKDLKVLRIVTSMNPSHGGVVEAINQAALFFRNTNHSIEVLCFDDPASDWIVNQDGYQIYAIGQSKTSYAINFNYFYWLYRNAREYDVIILDGLWQFHMLGGYLLKYLNVPFCVFTHGMLDPYFNKQKSKYFKKLPFWFLIERNVISMANATLFTCEEEKKLAQQSFPFYKSTSHITTLGVDKFKGRQSHLTDCFFKLFPELRLRSFGLFLSRIHPKKGLELLIAAIKNVTSIPDDFIFVIAGPYDEVYRRELDKLVEMSDIKNRIVWTGVLRGEAKWGAYYASDFFILPSHQENFGIVVAEALSTNTPVLITNKVNIWREIKTIGAGFIANDDDLGVQSLLEEWFELSETQKHLMSEKAFKCYKNNFSIQSAALKLESVLLEVT